MSHVPSQTGAGGTTSLLQRRKVKLLPADALVKTGPTDYPGANYQPMLGLVQKMRFRLAAKLLRFAKVPRLLEIGSGSGVFLPELARHCQELYGIDVHKHQAGVAAQLKRHGVAARLLTASAERLPLPNYIFDRVVAVSTLEFTANLDAVCSEVKRVMREDGEFVVVTPGYSALIDLGFRMLTDLRCEILFEDRRKRTIPMLRKHFKLLQTLTFPPYAPPLIRLYTAMRLVPIGSRGGDEAHASQSVVMPTPASRPLFAALDRPRARLPDDEWSGRDAGGRACHG